MITLSAFDRRLTVGDESRDVSLEAGQVRWLDAQTHSGENTGSTPTYVIFVELKGDAGEKTNASSLGPSE